MLTGFRTAPLPNKNYADICMSNDGKCITVVTYLDQNASSQALLEDFNLFDADRFKLMSSTVTGSGPRKTYINNRAVSNSNRIYQGNYFSDGSVYSSWDHGNTWYIQSGLMPRNWVSASMSSDGRIQAIAGRGLYKDFHDVTRVENTPTHIYISYDSGRSWQPKCSSRVWNGLTVSENGSVIIGSDTYIEEYVEISDNSKPIFKNNILLSTNTGHAWEISYDAPLREYYLNTNYDYYKSVCFSSEGPIAGVSSDKFSYFGRKQCSLSSNGQYQLIASPVHGVLVNNNFGSNSSSKLNPDFVDSEIGMINYSEQVPNPSNEGDQFANPLTLTYETGRLRRTFLPICCDMSSNGQYQVVAGQGFINSSGIDEIAYRASDPASLGRDWLSNIVTTDTLNPDIYVSTNYGQTWSGIRSLPSGLFCFSVSCSNDLKELRIIGRPNSTKYLSADGSYRYGAALTYAQYANYKSGVQPDSNLLYFSSSNSGLSWQMQEMETLNFSGFRRHNNYLSQRVIGNISYDSSKELISYFNFPETEYIPELLDIDNWNSRVLLSSDGARTLVLDQGRVFLSNSFPTTPAATIPTLVSPALIAGTYSWSGLSNNYPTMRDIAIGGTDGRYITYILNSGSFSGIFKNDFQSIIEYSSEVSGNIFDIKNYYIYTKESNPYGLIVSSQNSGLTWSTFRPPNLTGLFNRENTSFNVLTNGQTGLYPSNLSRIIISENGQYQTVFSDSIIASGVDLITQPDSSLKLYKTRFFSPYYRSTNYGASWSVSYIECGGPRGLSIRDADITSDGESQLFIGNNYFTAKFNKINSEDKYNRPDFSLIGKVQLLPFGENFYKNSISYNIEKIQGAGTALYASNDYGVTWLKSGLIVDITYSGTGEKITPGYNSTFYSAITSAVPSTNFIKYGSLLSGYSNQQINSIGFSDYTNGAGTPKTLYLTVENIFPNDYTISGGNIYEYENRFSNGYFHSTNSGSTWTYKTIQNTQKYCNKDPELRFFPTGSRKLKYLKANQDSSVLVALEEPFYNQQISSKPLGLIINHLSNKDDLRSVLTSYNSGSTWLESSPIGKIEYLTVSNDGNHISYLLKNTNGGDRFNNNFNSLLVNEKGPRYGIPYISHDRGQTFAPILRWELDIEYNRGAFVENELIDAKCYSYTSSNLSGSTESNLLNNAYDIIGCSAVLKSGFYERDSFVEKREIRMPIFEYLQRQDSLFENFSGLLFSSLDKYSTIHIDTNLYGLRYTKNGKHGIAVSNGAIQSNTNIFTSTNTEVSTNISNIENKFLGNKIYINDRYGDYQNLSRNYITGFGISSSLFPNFYSGIIITPTAISYNNPVKAIGTLFDKDLSTYYIGCNDNISKISRAASNQILFGTVGQEMFTYSGISLEDKITNGEIFSLSPGTNLYVNPGIVPTSFEVRAGYNLPPGLSLSTYNCIIGKPTQTGFWTCVIDPYYCTNKYKGPPSIINILIGPSSSILTGELRTLYVSAGESIDAVISRVKQANFTYDFDNFIFTNNLSGITGFGPISANPPSGTIFTGIINNPSGYFNLVSYETGKLTGQIRGSRSTFSWAGVEVTGTGVPNNIYFDFITGYKQSSNKIFVDTGRLIDGDILYLNETAFIYKDTQQEADTEPYWFRDLNKFLLSGAPLVGITGYVTNGNTLNLFSMSSSGEEANDFSVSRDTQDLFGIRIPNKYFTGGETLREKRTAPYTGFFYEYYSRITKENSGTYYYNNNISPYVGIGSGIVWNNNFSKNYTIITGDFSSDLAGEFSGSNVPFISSLGIYSGNGIVKSGQTPSFTGVKFLINRNKYTYSNTDISEYTIRGSDFLYSGRIIL